MTRYDKEIVRRMVELIEEGCPSCGLGNFPNMPGELCDECQEAAQVRVHPDHILDAI